MVLTVEELSKWKVETLRSYLKERGVSLSGSNRKADLIEKVVYAEKLIDLYRPDDSDDSL